LGIEAVEAFTNASVLGTREMWLGYVLGNAGQAIQQKASPHHPLKRLQSEGDLVCNR